AEADHGAVAREERRGPCARGVPAVGQVKGRAATPRAQLLAPGLNPTRARPERTRALAWPARSPYAAPSAPCPGARQRSTPALRRPAPASEDHMARYLPTRSISSGQLTAMLAALALAGATGCGTDAEPPADT